MSPDEKKEIKRLYHNTFGAKDLVSCNVSATQLKELQQLYCRLGFYGPHYIRGSGKRRPMWELSRTYKTESVSIIRLHRYTIAPFLDHEQTLALFAEQEEHYGYDTPVLKKCDKYNRWWCGGCPGRSSCDTRTLLGKTALETTTGGLE